MSAWQRLKASTRERTTTAYGIQYMYSYDELPCTARARCAYVTPARLHAWIGLL